MEHWLVSIGERYRAILDDPAAGIGQDDFVRVLIDILDDLETRYRGAFCFEELFYRLLTNALQREAQALVLLLGRISEEYRTEEAVAENPAEMEAAHTTAIRRLYAVLGNPNLRKKVLRLRW